MVINYNIIKLKIGQVSQSFLNFSSFFAYIVPVLCFTLFLAYCSSVVRSCSAYFAPLPSRRSSKLLIKKAVYQVPQPYHFQLILSNLLNYLSADSCNYLRRLERMSTKFPIFWIHRHFAPMQICLHLSILRGILKLNAELLRSTVTHICVAVVAFSNF